ncbi:MAG: carbohydrate kinase [Actinomycetota bacterium]|nr:carbohydrate kinase [Actinomycetota bacterium]
MILVCGEAVLDLQRRPGREPEAGAACFVAHPGGSPANTAVALARLGAPVGMCARLSASALGGLLRSHLESSGVDLRHCVEVPDPASLAFVDLDPSGAASYSFYVEGAADWGWRPGELPTDLPPDVTVLHTGSIASMRAPGRDAILEWLRHERRGRAVSFDPNVRPALVGTREDALRSVESSVGTADLVKASDEDVAWLYPGVGVQDVVDRWLDLGTSAVVVTAGSAGSEAFVRGARVARAARRVEVVDTVGAGDSFAAGLLRFLTREGLVGELRAGSLGSDALAASLDYAGAVAALTCTRAGADPPREDEVEHLLGSPA